MSQSKLILTRQKNASSRQLPEILKKKECKETLVKKSAKSIHENGQGKYLYLRAERKINEAGNEDVTHVCRSS
jgi:hypothetical protein